MSNNETTSCPFCNAAEIAVIRISAHRECKVMRGSGHSKIETFTVPEKVTVLGDCPGCKAKKSKLQLKLNGQDEETRSGKTCMRCEKELPDETKTMCDECAAWYKSVREKKATP